MINRLRTTHSPPGRMPRTEKASSLHGEAPARAPIFPPAPQQRQPERGDGKHAGRLGGQDEQGGKDQSRQVSPAGGSIAANRGMHDGRQDTRGEEEIVLADHVNLVEKNVERVALDQVELGEEGEAEPKEEQPAGQARITARQQPDAQEDDQADEGMHCPEEGLIPGEKEGEGKQRLVAEGKLAVRDGKVPHAAGLVKLDRLGEVIGAGIPVERLTDDGMRPGGDRVDSKEEK